MRKLVSVLLTVAVALSLMAMPAVTSAASPPTIDGVVTDGEWYGATVIDVAGTEYAGAIMGTVSVIAYTDYLYVLFDVKDSTDGRLAGRNDKIGLNINPTDGGPWGKPYDIVFQTGADPAAFTTTVPSGVSSGMSDNWSTEWVINGTQLPLPGDVVTRTIYSGSTRISEWEIPLASISPSPGATLKVGGACDNLNVGGGSEGGTFSYPPGLDWGDVATYIDVPVQQPTSTVGLTADTNQVTAINVDPTSIDFGPVNPGDVVSGPDITVENIGTVKVVVDAFLDPRAGTVFNYLRLNGAYSPNYNGYWDNIIKSMSPSESESFTTALDVPSTYSAQGTETATLIYEATPL